MRMEKKYEIVVTVTGPEVPIDVENHWKEFDTSEEACSVFYELGKVLYQLEGENR